MGIGTGVLTAVLLAGGRMREVVATPDRGRRLRYACGTCTGLFGERTAEAVIKRAAANRHGSAVTPHLEARTGVG